MRREFLVAYSKYEQQMHITNQGGGDQVLVRKTRAGSFDDPNDGG